MSRKINLPSRRGFLTGMLTGLGAASVAAVAGANQAKAANATTTEKPPGPILYRRTAETERYYKTLYT